MYILIYLHAYRPQEPHLRFMLLFLKHHNSDLSEVTVDAQRVLKVARRYVGVYY